MPFAAFNSDAIAFVSNENNIVSGDQDGLPDTFVARAGFPTIRLPLPAGRTQAPSALRLSAKSDQLLCDTELALTADDLDTSLTFICSTSRLQHFGAYLTRGLPKEFTLHRTATWSF